MTTLCRLFEFNALNAAAAPLSFGHPNEERPYDESTFNHPIEPVVSRGWRMNVGKTLFAQVMDASLGIDERIVVDEMNAWSGYVR